MLKWRCCSVEKCFLLVNYMLAMYAGSLLITATRLTLDPTTYAWFRFLLEAQYRVTTAYLFTTGVAVATLVVLAASAVFPTNRLILVLYMSGTSLVLLSEVAYSAWMYLSVVRWWGSSPQAELVRTAVALQDDLQALVAILQRHNHMAQEVTHAVHEVQQDAPKNAYTICVCLLLSFILQFASVILSWILHRRTRSSPDWGDSNKTLYSSVHTAVK